MAESLHLVSTWFLLCIVIFQRVGAAVNCVHRKWCLEAFSSPQQNRISFKCNAVWEPLWSEITSSDISLVSAYSTIWSCLYVKVLCVKISDTQWWGCRKQLAERCLAAPTPSKHAGNLRWPCVVDHTDGQTVGKKLGINFLQTADFLIVAFYWEDSPLLVVCDVIMGKMCF